MTAVAIRPHFRGSAASVGSLPTRPWSLPVSPLWRGAAHRGAQDGDWDNRAVLLVPFYRGDRVDNIKARGHLAENRIGSDALKWAGGAIIKTMKNWLPCELGAALRAMARTPRR